MFSCVSCQQCLLWWCLGYFTLQEMGFIEMEVMLHQDCLISSINQSNPQLGFNVSSLFVIRVVVLGDDVSENYWLHDLMLDFSPLPSGKIVLALNSLIKRHDSFMLYSVSKLDATIKEFLCQHPWKVFWSSDSCYNLSFHHALSIWITPFLVYVCVDSQSSSL